MSHDPLPPNYVETDPGILRGRAAYRDAEATYEGERGDHERAAFHRKEAERLRQRVYEPMEARAARARSTLIP